VFVVYMMVYARISLEWSWSESR